MKQFNLQLFSEEEGAASAAESPIAGDTTAGSSEGTEPVATAPTFDELIESNPEYKQAYESHLKEHMSKRFRNQKDNQAVIDKLNPFVSLMAQRYGVKAGEDGKYDIEAVTDAISNDTSMYEDEAYKRGMSVEDYMHLQKLEIENEQLRRSNQESLQDAKAREEFNALAQQAEELRKTLYPGLDLAVELNNPTFGTLVANGISVKNAYETIHMDEILAGGMHYAAQVAKENAAKSIQANAARPRENGLSSNSASNPGKVDISKLSKEQVADYIARAKAGEEISFQ